MKSEVYPADIIGLGAEVDILPYARDVVAECPYRHDFTAMELAILTARHAFGKYIKVDVQDRVAGRMIHAMIRQVIGRVRFDHLRKAQLLDPDLRRGLPSLQLLADLCVCEAAAAKTGRMLRDDELEPLPLPSCWGHSCSCSYVTERSTAPIRPAVSATFSGIVEIPDDDPDEDW